MNSNPMKIVTKMNSIELWQESDKVVDQMIKGSTGELWGKKLEQAGHFPLLNHLLNEIGHQGLLIDIGCGAGDVSRVWKGEYLGVDLGWVVDRVARVCNSTQIYKHIDVQRDELSELPSCRCVLMNALLDVLDNPSVILKKVCKSIDTDFVIVHRQKLSDVDSIQYGNGYGDSKVAISKMSIGTLKSICLECGIKSMKAFHWEGDYYSFILEMR
jgi:hypothetical protein